MVKYISKLNYEGKQYCLSNVVNELGLKMSSCDSTHKGGKMKKINSIIKHSALIVLISAHILHINHLIRLTLLK